MEDVLIPFIVFGFIALVVKMGLNYAKWKRANESPEDNSLRMSELKELVREAVAEANAPLAARMDRLEERLEALNEPRLLPAKEERISAEDLGEIDEGGKVEPVSQRTTRS